MTAGQDEPSAISAVPARDLPDGVRLLFLREFRAAEAPPAFAYIDQQLLRAPGRAIRHGMFFAPAFRAEVMDWLISRLGRPSLREGAGAPGRNPRWPTLAWHGAERHWPDGSRTVEWSVDIVFPEAQCAAAFRAQWRGRLDGAGGP
jgi:hypothetical protein